MLRYLACVALCCSSVAGVDLVSVTFDCGISTAEYNKDSLSCTESKLYTLSQFSLSSFYFKSVTFNGVILASVMGSNPSAWIGNYDWNRQAASVNNFQTPDMGCKRGDRICREATQCTMTHETTSFSQTHTCVLCPPRPCTTEEQSCRNGFVAPSPGVLVSTETNPQTGFKYVYQMPQCQLTCKPGYWLTCLNSDSVQGCSYMVPNFDVTSAVLDASKTQA